jgi:putative peptidoglycan lipid II flippase
LIDNVSQHRNQERNQVAVSAFWVALGTLTSRGLGFFRDLIMAHYFSRTATDVWVVAFRLPNLFRRLFGEGALTVSFIPVFTDFLKNNDKKGARDLASSVFTMLFVTLSVLTILGTLGAGPVVRFLSSGEGFTSVPGKMDLTVHQTKIMFCYIMLVSLYAFAMGVLNTMRVFWLPAVAPALWNIAMIVGILFFRHTFAIPEDVLAWATVVGGVLQGLILIPGLKKYGYIPEFRKWWNSPAVKKVLRAMGPSVLGLSVMQLAVLINTHFASQLEEGSNSWIFWADRILELPLSIFAVSVGTAALPALSSLWSRGDRSGMSEASLHALKLSLFMALPCAAGLYILSVPMVHTLFEHGRFTAKDTMMTAAVIQVYGFNVIFATGVRVLAPAFYAMKNTWLPALSAGVALCCHVVIATILTKKYGVVGLATSSVLSGGINFIFLIVAFQKFILPLNFANLLNSLGKFILASAALIIVASQHQFIESLLGDSHGARILSLGLNIGLASSAYFLVSWALKTPEMIETLGEFRRRFKNKLTSKKVI